MFRGIVRVFVIMPGVGIRCFKSKRGGPLRAQGSPRGGGIGSDFGARRHDLGGEKCEDSVRHRGEADLKEGHDACPHGQQPDAEPERVARRAMPLRFRRPGVGVQGGGKRAVGGTVHGGKP